MRLPLTLSLYIARRYLVYVAIVFVPAAGLTWMIDAAELTRRASSRPTVGLGSILQLAVYKSPAIIEELFAFVVLIAAIMTLWRLTRDQELVVVRAAGVSVWQFMLPILAATLLIGAFKLVIWNPMAAALYGRYERMAGIVFDGAQRSIAVSPAGFWVRQQDGGTTSIIHARRVLNDALELADIVVFNFAGTDRFIGRIDAASGRLADGAWVFEQATLTAGGQPTRHVPELRLPTTLTVARVQETLAPHESVSFWDLPAFIALLESAGFPAMRHRVHFQRLGASPLLLLSVVLMAATFSMRSPRRGGAAILIAAGIVLGFTVFLVSNVVIAFGRGGLLPPELAAWAPPLIWSLLAAAVLFHLEDG
jgi:lipopolysaccharide export system permease protein